VDSDRVWEGPIHGALGVLADDGERAQCHICGDYYGNLGGHVSQVHGVAPEDYKAFFGLNATTGLLGPALKQIRQEQADARKSSPAYARFMAAGAAARAALPPEQRSNRGRRLRLQQRLDPKVQAARRASLERANEVLRQRKASGLHTPAGWGDRDPREVSARGHEKLAELRQNPEWRADFARKVSEARGGRLKVTCVVCGTVFSEPQSHKGRKTCSPGCFAILRRRLVADRRDRLAADRSERQRRGIELGERRRHIGRSIEDVARRSGLSAAHVSRIERGLNVPSNQALEKIDRALREGGEPVILPDVLTV
jgi:hypothetical protein